MEEDILFEEIPEAYLYIEVLFDYYDNVWNTEYEIISKKDMIENKYKEIKKFFQEKITEEVL